MPKKLEIMKTPELTNPSIVTHRIKTFFASIAVAALAASASADTTNLFPNGDFSAGGPTGDWAEVNCCGNFVYNYPATGGNPGGYGTINNQGPTDFFGIWVNGDTAPLPISSFGLTAGQTYTFVQDMKIISGSTIGGFKIDWFDGANAQVGTTTDLRPSTAGHNTANWETYSFVITIPSGAVGMKIVPLWGQLSEVAFDNIGVVIPTTSPLAAAITSPGNSATVGTNFTINASASVLPGSVTNVYFYDGATLLGNDDTTPYSVAATGFSLGAHGLKVVAKASTGGSVTSAVVNVTVVADPYLFTVDPTKTWVGYLNWFETPANGGGYANGGPWGTSDLRATFSGSVLSLKPNTIGDPAGYWYVSTGDNSVGNKIQDASMYVEPGSLPGVTMTFAGTVLANTLTGLDNTNPAGNGWTCVAFIKDFAPDFSSSVVVTTPLTNGTTFSISLATVNDPARHIQYGFETVGPCVWATDTALAGYGNVQVGPLSNGPTSVSITPSLSGGNLLLAFPTQTGFTYTVQYKTNLLSATWTTLTTTNGTGATATVTSALNAANRFYRLQIQ